MRRSQCKYDGILRMAGELSTLCREAFMAIESDAILPFNTVLRKCPSNAPLSPFLARLITPRILLPYPVACAPPVPRRHALPPLPTRGAHAITRQYSHADYARVPWCGPVAVGRDVPIAPPRHRRGARLGIPRTLRVLHASALSAARCAAGPRTRRDVIIAPPFTHAHYPWRITRAARWGHRALPPLHSRIMPPVRPRPCPVAVSHGAVPLR